MKKSSFLFILLINIILINTLFAYYGAKYLIIAPDNFVSELQQFADWKTKKGIKTMIVPLSVTGSSASQIKNYILNAYNNWQIRPEYILLAGHGSVLATSGSSDDYFADMGGSYLIELSIGRLPASNLDQLRNIVNKTLNYERYPYLTDTLWFRKGMTIVREDYSGYPPTQYPDTYYWENARYVFTQWLRNGYVYVDSLSKNRGHSSTDIVNGITDGRAYVLFRGQSTTNWWTPFSTEPNNCNNGYKLPVVVSGTCATMSLSSTGYAADRFINAGSVTTPKGSVGFFASTMTSSGSGLAMQRGTVSVGFFRSVFEDKVYAMGDAAKRAKFILDSIQPAGYSSDRYREWNLFGDPTLQLWTDAPKPMLVLYDSVIPSTQSSLQITVRNQNNNAVPNALVCLRMDTIIYTWGYTNMQGLINLSFTPQASGIMDITVTAPNYIPFENTIRFIPANQPYINIVSYNFTEQLGNNDGKINPGEQIQLSVILRNDGNISAPNVQAYLRTNNPYITIQDSLCEYGTIAVGESVISQQIYRFWVSSNCRNNE
ncbi:MAG: C25 family cysteine peptidase, partial [candidate division WOR-3 bacterium]